MRTPKPTTVDFETDKIGPRPHYPPKPVGVSIKPWGKPARYWAWGHPTKNNCTLADAKRALRAVWNNPEGLLFQNGKFDVDVAVTHMGMPMPSWERIHDTLYLLYLRNPHARSFQLKPSADDILGMKAEERDAVVEWLMEHSPVINNTRLSRSPNSPNFAGAYVAYAPGDVVGRYANGDSVRTEKLFRKLWAEIVESGMQASYDRERRLMPHLLDNERQGVAVDVKRLTADIADYQVIREKCIAWIQKRLKAPDLNVNSGDQLVAAMLATGRADEALLGRTSGGSSGITRVQTNKDAIKRGVTDKVLAAVLQYLSQLSTCLDTFMVPWLETALRTGGLIHTSWNQVRNSKGNGFAGARTGRLSSSPNFQNIPKEFAVFWEAVIVPLMRDRFIRTLPMLPLVRSYVIPFKDEIIIDRDYNQQELRILAHFEDGGMKQAYEKDMWLDFHDMTRDTVSRMLGKVFPRTPIKIVNFGIIYGMGYGLLAERSGTTVDVARELKQAILTAFPGVRDIFNEMKGRAAAGQPIRTWGGRLYYCEEPHIKDGKYQTFEYKLVNYLVQGSAADCAKEAVIRYCEAKPKHHRMLLQVHDQLNASVPPKDMARGMKIMREAMESVEFDVPMLSEGKASPFNWAKLDRYDVKGEVVWRGR